MGRLSGLLAVLIAATIAACGGGGSNPSGPSAAPLPLAAESANFRFFYSPGDSVQVARQEAFHDWAVAQLGVRVPQKIEYRKYTSRDEMGARTGAYNTNAYAEPALFTVHTLWTWDNHETVHIYTALVGYPSEFFNEGIAVAMQTNPLAGDYVARSNGLAVHEAAKMYRQAGALSLPLSRIVTTTGFRAIGDSTLSYCEAGSFVAFLVERFGMARVLNFFRTSTRDDSLDVIGQRFATTFGLTLDEAEAAWLAFVG